MNLRCFIGHMDKDHLNAATICHRTQQLSCRQIPKVVAINPLGDSGFIVVSAGTANRNRHSAYMVIGVQKSFWGQGIGSALMAFMESWGQ